MLRRRSSDNIVQIEDDDRRLLAFIEHIVESHQGTKKDADTALYGILVSR